MTSSERLVGIPRPSRIRAARDLRGLTQGEAVGAMDSPITAAALSQIESGKVIPTAKTLSDLATVLGVPREFFFAEWDANGSDDVLAHVTYFRDLAATPAKERRRAAALALLLSILTAAIESRIELPKVRIPPFNVDPDADRTEIDGIAEAVRGEWGLGDGPVSHVIEQIEKHGVPVARLSMGGTRVDAFSVRFKPRPLILLTDDKSNYVRSRFDAAHELGHLVMHARSDALDRSIEIQAHDFASSFLMPDAIAREILPKRIDGNAWLRLAELKREWGMSIASLLYRAHAIGLLNSDSYRNAMKYMSARGWRKLEPGDRQLGLPEAPRMFDKALELIAAEFGESFPDVARSAHLPIDDASQLLVATRDRRPRLSV